MPGGADGNTDEFLDVIRATRARYVAGFGAQLDLLRTLTDKPSRDQLETLRTAVHRMVGLSATLGFRSVGALAAELEDIVVATGGGFDRDAAMRVIQSMTDAMARDLDTPPAWAEPDLE